MLMQERHLVLRIKEVPVLGSDIVVMCALLCVSLIVRTIGDCAFEDCENLKSVSISKKTSYHKRGFKGIGGSKTPSFPKGCTVKKR